MRVFMNSFHFDIIYVNPLSSDCYVVPFFFIKEAFEFFLTLMILIFLNINVHCVQPKVHSIKRL